MHSISQLATRKRSVAQAEHVSRYWAYAGKRAFVARPVLHTLVLDQRACKVEPHAAVGRVRGYTPPTMENMQRHGAALHCGGRPGTAQQRAIDHAGMRPAPPNVVLEGTAMRVGHPPEVGGENDGGWRILLFEHERIREHHAHSGVTHDFAAALDKHTWHIGRAIFSEQLAARSTAYASIFGSAR